VDKSVTSLEIEWPSGTKQKLGDVSVNRLVTVDESKGIL